MAEMIKVNHVMQDKINGKWTTTQDFGNEEITLETFERSFVRERWEGERRTNKQYTKLGYFHTKTTVNMNESYRSVRTFVFPE